MSKLRKSADGERCVACGVADGTVVFAHYFGVRRHAYGGGLGIKGSDAVGAFLCARDHARMDTQSRDKAKKWEHSEEFLHYCALTLIRWLEKGTLK